MKKAFHEAVDDYLEIPQRGREPHKPFKGSFNIRIPSDLHKKLREGYKDGSILNQFVQKALEEKVAV